MQRVVRKMGLPFVIVAALTLLAVSAGSLILAVGYRDQLRGFRQTVYARCIQQSTTNDSTRTAQLRYYQHLLVNLRRHPSPQAQAFDAQLERNVAALVTQLQRALVVGNPAGCAVYR